MDADGATKSAFPVAGDEFRKATFRVQAVLDTGGRKDCRDKPSSSKLWPRVRKKRAAILVDLRMVST